MKTTILTAIVALLTTLSSFAQHYSSFKFNQVIPIRKVTDVSLNMHSANVEIIKTKGSVVVVETTVKLSTELHIAKHIKETGRYDIDIVKNGDEAHVILSDTKFVDHINFRGERVKEHISYTFYIPDHVKMNDEALAFRVE